MFFALLCILLWALIALQVPFDKFGWLMLVATGWVAGFLDCRMRYQLDKDPSSGLPPDMKRDHPEPDTFETQV